MILPFIKIRKEKVVSLAFKASITHIQLDSFSLTLFDNNINFYNWIVSLINVDTVRK